jgi:hypothetical protein
VPVEQLVDPGAILMVRVHHMLVGLNEQAKVVLQLTAIVLNLDNAHEHIWKNFLFCKERQFS